MGDSYLTKPSQQRPDPEPSLATLGADSFRFTTAPALGWGEASIVTIVPDAQGDAIATPKTVRRECRDQKCHMVSRRGPSFAFCIDGDCGYHSFAGRIRVLLFDPARMPRNASELVICTDGPGYLTELRQAAQTFNPVRLLRGAARE